MNKEYLEAFGRITLHTEYDNDSSYDCLNFEDDCKLVYEALERLEAIDNANSSEALKYLEDIEKRCKSDYEYCIDCYDYKKELSIKNYILKAQEQEKENVVFVGGRIPNKDIINLKQSIKQCNDKPIYYVSRSFGNKYIVPQELFEKQCNVLSIINNKEVDVKLFFNALFREQQYRINPLEFYNGTVSYKRLWLTQEEFELLKRWVECQKN